MNPWIIVAFIVAVGCSAGSGFLYGKHVEGAEREAKIAQEQRTEITQANTDTAADTNAAVKNEKQKAKQREADLGRRYQLEIDIERTARKRAEASADCPAAELDPESYGLLLNAIAASNDKAAASALVPQSGPRDRAAAGRLAGKPAPPAQ